MASDHVARQDPGFDEGDLKSLVKFSKIVIPLFGVFALISVFLLIVGFVPDDNTIFMIWILCLFNIVISLFSAWGIFKWGTVDEQIDRFRSQNNVYEGEILEMRGTAEKLGAQITELNQVTRGLQKNASELEDTLHTFDKLREELAEICKDNEHLNNMIDDLNGMCHNMKKACLQNEKAHLLEIYYDVEFRDESEGMNEREYTRFLGKLTKKQREQFKALGTFNQLCGNDGVIDCAEMQEYITQLLNSNEEQQIFPSKR